MRYFIEVRYKGTRYAGFQVQENANTIQWEVEKAINLFFKQPLQLTGSSRTDSGVHALQNFFHFDTGEVPPETLVYKLNAVLPPDIVAKRVVAMPPQAHSRFDAISRRYTYRIHRFKDPFLTDTSLYFPYRVNEDIMQQAAALLLTQTNYFAFAKSNTQVKNFHCNILHSHLHIDAERIVFTIEGNRFLRGMVRMLTASLLKLGRDKLPFDEFASWFAGHTKCRLSTAAHGLFLEQVRYPDGYFTEAP